MEPCYNDIRLLLETDMKVIYICSRGWSLLLDWTYLKSYSTRPFCQPSSWWLDTMIHVTFWVDVWWFIIMTSPNGNIFRVTGPLWGEFTGHRWIPLQRPVTQSFDVFFDLRLNKQLSKQSRRRWFETPSLSLWYHYNVLLVWFVVLSMSISLGQAVMKVPNTVAFYHVNFKQTHNVINTWLFRWNVVLT